MDNDATRSLVLQNDSSVTFAQALDYILERSVQGNHETVPLAEIYQRITAEAVSAKIPEPGYNQSMRDGFVIGGADCLPADTSCSYTIMGEIPAGMCDVPVVERGEAYRIMTGGLIPEGAERVVQQEDCHISGEFVTVPVDRVKCKSHYIQKKGAYVAQGQLLAPAGSQIGAHEVAQFAATGNAHVSVYQKVRISFFCTGSELVAVDKEVPSGKKISSNRYLLDSLIKGCQALSEDFGIVDDDDNTIQKLLSEIMDGTSDIIVSTGGTGPGKYDLLDSYFEKLGGTIIFRSIEMSPGRSMLFGTIAGKLYFGLPGPPSAVTILFRELVLPAVRKIQGRSAFQYEQSEALITHDILSAKSGFHAIKEGVLFSRGCNNYVRVAKRHESPNCHIHLGPSSETPVNGETVTVHRIDC